MAAKPNPVHPIIDEFCRRWGGIADNLKRSVNGYIKQGYSPDVAAVKAIASTRTGDETTKAIFASVVESGF